VTKKLDLLDIQGNIIRGYGRFGYPVARYVFFNIRDAEKGREFVGRVTEKVTTSANWGDGPNEVPQPNWTVNIAFAYQGLKELELPRESLIGFSAEFASGMKARKDILGDDETSAPEYWDPIWQRNREERDADVHIFVSLNARSPELLEEAYAWLTSELSALGGGVALLSGHLGDNGARLDYQDGKLLVENGQYSAREHFGYIDGIGDPVFEGAPGTTGYVKGRGKQMSDGSWAPLATGEFLFGHVDEAREYPPAPKPMLLARNGTYLIYRKLHQNVGTFHAYLDEQGKRFPGGRDLLAAKFVGRWPDNGAPLVKAPDAESKEKFDAAFNAAVAANNHQLIDELLSDFTFDEDMSGGKCPFSAHIRRINPRAALQMTHEHGDKPGSMKISKDAFDSPSALSDRRRLLRRGLPYGEVKDPSRDDGNHGIVIMMLNADINRQFEFVQQQWINYGNDFKAANDKEIMLGNHGTDPRFPSKAVIQVEPDSDAAPHFLPNIPRFVETRGGEYFFVPSLTALRMIAQGLIDPT
jgi:Dyp-type peroxidase family